MTGPGDFEVTVEDVGGATVARVVGDLDLATTADFEAAIADVAPSGKLVVDLSECPFLDSTALRALVLAGRARETAGGSAVLVARQPGILRVLEISGIDRALRVVPTLDEAL